MKNSGGQKRGLTSRMVFGTLVIFVTSVWLYSSGDVFYLEADPMAVDALPGHLVTVSLARPAATLEVDLVVRLESLNPEIALVPESVVIPRGATSSEIPVAPLRSGTANIRASAELFGEVVFTINVLDGSGPLEQVNPETIRLRLARGETAMVPVSVQVPPDTIPTVVDLVFAVDGRASFASAVARLQGAVPSIVSTLKSTYPRISFSFAVTKFLDYGGPGKIFHQLGPESDFERPFALIAPTMSVETTAGVAALANAIGVTLPGASDPSTFASYLEALVQIAQGAGFDGNDNGSRTESGPAGVAGSAAAPITLGYLNPGASGDVAAFSTKPATVPSVGTLGGVGFRAGSQKIVLLATNTYPVSPIDRGKPFPDVITGVGEVEVPSSFFQEVQTFPLLGSFQNQRYGSESASASVADPVNSVAPKGAATLVNAFDLLADMNIEVVSFFQISEPATRGLIDPKLVLSAIAQLTGALDSNRVPLTFELIGGNASDVANQIVEAIRPLLTGPKRVTLRAVGNDENFGFAFTPQAVTVPPGGQAQFQTTITGTGGAGMFEIHFVTEDGAVLGRIPVSINLGGPPMITGVNPTAGPAGTPVTITGTDFSNTPSEIQVRFGDLAAQVVSSTLTSIQTAVPAGAVAGPVNIVVTVSGMASNAVPFTIQHRITSFTPTLGPPGTPFVIQGTGFAPTVGGNTVTFGTAAATITAATNTEIRGTVPNLAAGPYPVRVTTNGVTTDVGTFMVILMPVLTNIVPDRGPGGTPFAITGTGFSTTAAQNTITFTDTQTGATANATVTSATATRLEGTVPAQLVAGPHTVRVTVTGGQPSMPLNFTVTPQITAVTPATAVILQRLEISGTGFSPTLSDNVVTLNGRAVALLPASSASTLVVIVPLGTSGAGIDVVVTTRGIASNTFRVALSQIPGIQTVSGIFETRERLVIRITGFHAGGNLASAAIVIRDGEQQVLGFFPSVTLPSGQTEFNLSVPFDNANHFTAAMTVTVQLRDAAGNTSNLVTGPIVNPDIRGSVP
jgi:IPT/TIG domain